MAVAILERIAIENVTTHNLNVVACDVGGIHRDKSVGHNAATAIDRATRRGDETQALVEVDRVGREHLVVGITLVDLAVVTRHIARGVGLLYRATRRGEVARCSQSQCRSVIERNLLLHQSLTERAATHDHAAVVVLQRTRQNLARRGALLIDQHRQRDVSCGTRAVGVLLLAHAVTILGIDDHSLFGQQFVGNQNRLIEESARIATQVEDQLVHTLSTQEDNRTQHLGVGVLGKGRQTYETDVVGQHKCRIDALQRNSIARNRHIDSIFDRQSFECQSHLATSLSAQHLHDAVLRHALSRHVAVVDANDAVAILHTRLLAGSRRHYIEHNDRVGGHIEDHADTVELTLERLVHRLHILCGDIDRVGVELLHQQWQHLLGDRIHIERVDILVLDQCHRAV